ncbi:hypothetical protein G6N76_09910 [Rhizobium daejeonense]|uniref:Uncharacterized protein n=1 Tax=Rhizobium daejeonense TaxID=240521 RepID=A0A6M1RY35_9HYPH|nr:hypothetical protein [Rhizobium daejeonense]NGO63989.1 hypothetical protein [Rhizobium daejeonense]
MNLEDAASAATIASFFVAVMGFLFIWMQIRDAKLTSSASAISAIYEKLVVLINELPVQNDEPELWKHAFTNVLNQLELACAVCLDGQISGRTGRLGVKLISDILSTIEEDDVLRKYTESAVHSPETFINIRDFCRKHKSSWQGLVVT